MFYAIFYSDGGGVYYHYHIVTQCLCDIPLI
ncbi:hypothetical protein X965_18160 [Morganella sp. EGD-HP17]|nr:hypothetical protein X965_18160 [Morganella sp. EGD-HP17]